MSRTEVVQQLERTGFSAFIPIRNLANAPDEFNNRFAIPILSIASEAGRHQLTQTPNDCFLLRPNNIDGIINIGQSLNLDPPRNK